MDELSAVTPPCACERFARLTGAAVNAYQTQFLRRDAGVEGQYHCRVCGRAWQRVNDSQTKTAVLEQITMIGDE